MPNGMPMPDPTICNSTTHYCLANTFNGVDAEAVCCPKACLENEIYANGKCYTQIELGEKCEIDAQCSMGQCGPQGENKLQTIKILLIRIFQFRNLHLSQG